MRSIANTVLVLGLVSMSVACSASSPDEGDRSTEATTPASVWVQPQNGACADVGAAVNVPFDAGYIAGVVEAETGFLCGAFGLTTSACSEHYKAQAVAARTYVMRAIESDPTLGTRGNPIHGSPCFQAWNASPNSLEVNAATSTANVTMTYGGRLIDANYDAGGYAFDGSGNPRPPSFYHWSPYSTWDAARAACCGSSNPSNCVFPGAGDESVWTQIYVTNNRGKSGGAVSGTCQASSDGRNRGALGQNESAELAMLWVDGTFTYRDILRFFYGSDVTIGGSTPPPPTGNGGDGSGAKSGACTSAEYAAQNVNGASLWTCEGNARYVCDAYDEKIVESCAAGCKRMGVGADDVCNGSGSPQCTAAEIANARVSGVNYWTCEGNTRYLCDEKGNKVVDHCLHGCTPMGYATDDQCNDSACPHCS